MGVLVNWGKGGVIFNGREGLAFRHRQHCGTRGEGSSITARIGGTTGARESNIRREGKGEKGWGKGGNILGTREEGEAG